MKRFCFVFAFIGFLFSQTFGQVPPTALSGYNGIAFVFQVTPLPTPGQYVVRLNQFQGGFDFASNSNFNFNDLQVGDVFFNFCGAYVVTNINPISPGILVDVTVETNQPKQPSPGSWAAMFRETTVANLVRLPKLTTDAGNAGLTREDYQCLTDWLIEQIDDALNVGGLTIDSTRLVQDSILQYYAGASLIRQDTIRPAGSVVITGENGVSVVQGPGSAVVSGLALQTAISDSAAQIRSEIDSTRMIQDSIAIYYQNGSEIGRDTIRTFVAGAMTWANLWVNRTYERNEVVLDQPYLMIANKQTNDRAGPVRTNDPAYLLPKSPSWSGQTETTISFSGVDIQTTEVVELDAIRVWIPSVAVDYEVYLIDVVPDPDLVLESFTIDPGSTGWFEISVTPRVLFPGSNLRVVLVSNNTTASGSWSHNWTALGNTAAVDPGSGNYGRNTSFTEIYISETDDGATDQSAELDLLNIGDHIIMTEAAAAARFNDYIVSGTIVDNGTWRTIPVLLSESGQPVRNGNLVDVKANYNNASINSPYVEILNYWTGNQPTGATVQGFHTDDYVGTPPVLNNNAYGADVRATVLSVSPDWDFMSTYGSSIGGGVSPLITTDSTRLFQDSILIYYQLGVEVKRDTIRTQPTPTLYTANGTLTNNRTANLNGNVLTFSNGTVQLSTNNLILGSAGSADTVTVSGGVYGLMNSAPPSDGSIMAWNSTGAAYWLNLTVGITDQVQIAEDIIPIDFPVGARVLVLETGAIYTIQDSIHTKGLDGMNPTTNGVHQILMNNGNIAHIEPKSNGEIPVSWMQPTAARALWTDDFMMNETMKFGSRNPKVQGIFLDKPTIWKDSVIWWPNMGLRGMDGSAQTFNQDAKAPIIIDIGNTSTNALSSFESPNGGSSINQYLKQVTFITRDSAKAAVRLLKFSNLIWDGVNIIGDSTNVGFGSRRLLYYGITISRGIHTNLNNTRVHGTKKRGVLIHREPAESAGSTTVQLSNWYNRESANGVEVRPGGGGLNFTNFINENMDSSAYIILDGRQRIYAGYTENVPNKQIGPFQSVPIIQIGDSIAFPDLRPTVEIYGMNMNSYAPQVAGESSIDIQASNYVSIISVNFGNNGYVLKTGTKAGNTVILGGVEPSSVTNPLTQPPYSGRDFISIPERVQIKGLATTIFDGSVKVANQAAGLRLLDSLNMPEMPDEWFSRAAQYFGRLEHWDKSIYRFTADGLFVEDTLKASEIYVDALSFVNSNDGQSTFDSLSTNQAKGWIVRTFTNPTDRDTVVTPQTPKAIRFRTGYENYQARLYTVRDSAVLISDSTDVSEAAFDVSAVISGRATDQPAAFQAWIYKNDQQVGYSQTIAQTRANDEFVSLTPTATVILSPGDSISIKVETSRGDFIVDQATLKIDLSEVTGRYNYDFNSLPGFAYDFNPEIALTAVRDRNDGDQLKVAQWFNSAPQVAGDFTSDNAFMTVRDTSQSTLMPLIIDDDMNGRRTVRSIQATNFRLSVDNIQTTAIRTMIAVIRPVNLDAFTLFGTSTASEGAFYVQNGGTDPVFSNVGGAPTIRINGIDRPDIIDSGDAHDAINGNGPVLIVLENLDLSLWSTGLRFGYRGSGNAFSQFAGEWGRIMVFESDLTADQRRNLERRLMNLYVRPSQVVSLLNEGQAADANPPELPGLGGGGLVSSDNGLSDDGTVVKLGGTLNQIQTTIDAAGVNNNLLFSGINNLDFSGINGVNFDNTTLKIGFDGATTYFGDVVLWDNAANDWRTFMQTGRITGGDLQITMDDKSIFQLGDDDSVAEVNTSGNSAFYAVGVAPVTGNQASFYAETGRIFLNQHGSTNLGNDVLAGINLNYARGNILGGSPVQVGDRGLKLRWSMQDANSLPFGQWNISPEVVTAPGFGTVFSDLVFYREPSAVGGGYTDAKTITLVGSNGNVRLNEYLNTRNDTLTTAPVNFLYTDGLGTILSSPITYSGIGGGGGGSPDGNGIYSGSGTLPSDIVVTGSGFDFGFSGLGDFAAFGSGQAVIQMTGQAEFRGDGGVTIRGDGVNGDLVVIGSDNDAVELGNTNSTIQVNGRYQLETSNSPNAGSGLKSSLIWTGNGTTADAAFETAVEIIGNSSSIANGSIFAPSAASLDGFTNYLVHYRLDSGVPVQNGVVRLPAPVSDLQHITFTVYVDDNDGTFDVSVDTASGSEIWSAGSIVSSVTLADGVVAVFRCSVYDDGGGAVYRWVRVQ